MYSIDVMRFNHVTEDLFSSQTTIRVLRTLLQNPMRPFTGRELAGESGAPPLRTLESLRKLAAQGLVQVREAGRSLMWSLVPDHALRPGLQSWFDFEREVRQSLLDDIRASLAPLPFVRRVVLFGSVARGDEQPNSDIDLFILVDHEGNKGAVEKALRPLRDRVQSTFTNPLRPLIYDQRELDRKRNLGVVRNIRKEGVALVEKQPIRTEKLDRSRARIYLQKAEEFARSMRQSAVRGDWNAVGLEAVHAVISAADAVTTAKLGLRSRAADHEEVVKLIRNLPSKQADAKAEQAQKVLEVKNLVEYEARTFEQAEAQATMKQAERFVIWARGELKS